MSRQRAAERGFTLIELLCVLMIVSFVMGIVYPKFLAKEKNSVEAVAREITLGLRRERTGAMAEGQTRIVSLSNFQKYLAPNMMLTADPSAEDDAEGSALVFHPNGASTGTRWFVVDGERSVSIDIDWLTGDIRVDRPGT